MNNNAQASIVWSRVTHDTGIAETWVSNFNRFPDYSPFSWGGKMKIDYLDVPGGTSNDAPTGQSDTAIDDAGNQIFIWQQDIGNGNFGVYIRRYNAFTNEWDPTAQQIGPLTAGESAESPRIVYTPSGTALAIWRENTDWIAMESDNGGPWINRGILQAI